MLRIAMLCDGDVRESKDLSGSVYKGLCKLGKVEVSAPYLTKPEELKGFDLIVTNGQKYVLADVIAYHKGKIPVLTYDMGWIDRENHHQLCLDGLNNINYDIKKPSSLDVLSDRVGYDVGVNADLHIFFTQKQNDGQHKMSQTQIDQLVLNWQEDLISKGIDPTNIVQKPHPKALKKHIEGVTTYLGNFDEAMSDCIQAYTYNSTSCVELMSNRVPVVVLDKTSMYAKIDQSSAKAIQDFFDVLSGNQYTTEEMEDPKTYLKYIEIFNKQKEAPAVKPKIEEPFKMPNTKNSVNLRESLKKLLEVKDEPLVKTEEEVPVKELEDLEIRMNNEQAQKWYDENKSLKFMALKKKVIGLTGVAPKNGSDVINVLNTYFTSL